ncbi:unnamed protein product [Thlaspi arvense]|uniref:Replication protein A 70 kDa DNA-binding subunit B/D first OB fold domain-containing protein n=1 Tax=Thlaspi arvense TaxID=13288 RepID=A0AAU9RUA1_THLAR|nr:unnamed protein product [Thlaspi arvense]
MSSSRSNSQNEVRNHIFFNEIESGLRKEELVFRVIHFWEARNPTKGGLLMGLELLLIDEQGTVIQGFIAPNRMGLYDEILKRNSIYRLNNFFATNNKHIYRVTDHNFTICFTDLSILTELSQDAYSIDAQSFKFQSFKDFEAKADMRGDLYGIAFI